MTQKASYTDKSSQQGDKDSPPRDYRDTLFLPKTDFPMRAGLPKREPEWLRRWSDTGLYQKLRDSAQGKPKFILHDGPPYANGSIHVGTAMNKILKDITLRAHQMAGFDAPYVPGWDCHGLPIEWKVEEAFRAKGRRKEDVPITEFRAACRVFAEKWLGIQREEFQRLGVLGDWDNPYITMSYEAEAVIVAEFLKFARQGLIYRGAKPVMWSPVEQTALAEAEIEYHERESPQIWVRFPVLTGSDSLRGADFVIWTTTPWTLPANRAIAYGENIAYAVFEVQAVDSTDFAPWIKAGERLIVAEALMETVAKAARITQWRRVHAATAEDLKTAKAAHPLKGEGYDFDVPLLAGQHVEETSGTGFVHTAPGHGVEDYALWRAHGFDDIPDLIGPDGTYYDHVPLFAGEKILKTEGKKTGQDGGASKAVMDALIQRGRLLARGRLKHSYPHSWRSKAPVIFRNTPQWFLSLDKNGLREKALEAITTTNWIPARSENRIRSMVEDRPDWLLSRQRSWGVPLTLFVHKRTGEPLRDPDVDARIIKAVKEKGADAWFESPAEDFLGPDYTSEDWEPVQDILDVWFDSGATHAFVLEEREELGWPADLYLEGSDQHRGWFQSSLLEACGTRGKAPYKAVLTHGFVVDEYGRKMGKSLNNAIRPEDIIRQYGAEILRIWTASSDYTDDLRLGPEIIKAQLETYRKLRNTLRYLLGGLHGFTEEERLPFERMPALERWILHRLSELDQITRRAYQACDFRRLYSALIHFCGADLSAFYFDVRKDTLYCDRPDSEQRRACRTVMDLVFEHLTSWLAPVLCFTMEEAWLTRFPSSEDSVHHRLFPKTPETWHDEALGERWSVLRRLRRVVTGALEEARRTGDIGSSLEAAPDIYVTDPTYTEALGQEDLAALCITSQASLFEQEGPSEAFRLEDAPGLAVIVKQAEGHKCARSWRILPEVGKDPDYPDLSLRDADAVRFWESHHG